MGDGITNRYALIINGAEEYHHFDNVRLAKKSLSRDGYKVDIVSAKSGGGPVSLEEAKKAFEKLASENLDDDDEVVLYTTGYGAMDGEGPTVGIADSNLSASEFVPVLKGLKAKKTIVMDQNFGGNFANYFVGDPSARFISISAEGSTDYCRPFAKRFWAPSRRADDNRDGHISWQERFDWAAHDTRELDYSLSIYFTGENIDERPFKGEGIRQVGSADDLGKELEGLEGGQYAVVMFSAPWCGVCQAYKPKLERAVDGRFRVTIAENKDPSLFGSFGLRGPIPQLRLYGMGIPKEGLLLNDRIKLDEAVPVALVSRNQLATAKHWLESGTEEEQRRAVAMFSQILIGYERFEFYKNVFLDEKKAVSIREKALIAIDGMIFYSEYNFEVKPSVLGGYLQIASDEKMPRSIRVIAACLYEDKITHDTAGDPRMDLIEKLITDAFISREGLSEDAKHYAAQNVSFDSKAAMDAARQILNERIDMASLKGLSDNYEAYRLFPNEMMALASDVGMKTHVRANMIMSEALPWTVDERKKAIWEFLVSAPYDGGSELRVINMPLIDESFSREEKSRLAFDILGSQKLIGGSMLNAIAQLWESPSSSMEERKKQEELFASLVADGDTTLTSEDIFREIMIFENMGRLDLDASEYGYKIAPNRKQPDNIREIAITCLSGHGEYAEFIVTTANDVTEPAQVREAAVKWLKNICRNSGKHSIGLVETAIRNIDDVDFLNGIVSDRGIDERLRKAAEDRCNELKHKQHE